MKIKPDHKLLQYQGRMDVSDPLAPVWVFPCTSVAMKFTGTQVKVTLENHRVCLDNYMGYILDGRQGKFLLPESGKALVTIGRGLEDGEHELLLFKRMDSCHTVTFYGFELEDGAQVLALPEQPSRKIEVYGDSVSAGEVSEAVAYVGKEDPEHNGEFSNSWYSYAWMTARKLKAQIHDIAQGGIALLDGTGWFGAPEFKGMESCFDRIIYHPALGPATDWDFTKYRPQVVLIALGQNDSNPEDYMAKDYQGPLAENWRNHYQKFAEKIRALYPQAEIILKTTILEHRPEWDRAIEEVCRKLQEKDAHIHHFRYSNNGCGTKGHVRIPEAEQMAEELAGFIRGLGEEIWREEI